MRRILLQDKIWFRAVSIAVITSFLSPAPVLWGETALRPLSSFERTAFFKHAYSIVTKEKLEQLRNQRVRVFGNEETIAIGEDVDISDWKSGEIHAGAVILGRAKIEDGVRCLGTVEDAIIHKNVTILPFARVTTDPDKDESWELSPHMHKVTSQRAEIGEKSVIDGVVENARIGKNCRLIANKDAQGNVWRPYVSDGSIGDDNEVVGAVRIWIANLANNRVIGNFDESGITTGPLEVTDFSEDAVFSGMRFGQAGRGGEYYVEYVEGFYLPLTTMDPDGEYKGWDIPGRFTQGRNSMCMEFSGMLKPGAEEIKAITGREKSGHGMLVMFPFAVVGANAKLIGAPDFGDRDSVKTPGDVMDRYDRTFMGSFSVLWPGCEGWGRIGAFSRRRGLSISQEDIGWVLRYAPGVIIDQLKALMDLPEFDSKKLDGVIEALISTEIQQLSRQHGILQIKAGTLGYLPSSPENSEKLKRTEARIKQLEEGISVLQEQYKSGVWEIKDGKFTKPWLRVVDGTYSCEGWIAGPKTDEKQQYTLRELLQETPGKEYPVRTMKAPFSAKEWEQIEANVKSGNVIVEEGAQVHPDAVLLPGTIVRNGATVEEGAVLRGVEVPSGTVIRKNADVSLCVIEGARSIGEGAKLSMMRINHDIGKGVVGVMTYNYSPIGDKTTLRSYSGVGEGSDIGPNCTVGGLVEHTNWAGGNIRNEHLGTTIDYEIIPPLDIEITDSLGAVHRATLNPPVTHGAGTTIQGTAEAPVRAVAAFFAGMGIIKKGSSIIAGLTKMGLGEGERVGVFTRSDGPGVEKKSIGGLLAMLSYMMRHELSYTMKATPKPDKWAVGYMVEFLIVKELEEEILPHFGETPLANEVRKLIRLMNEDFKDMSTNRSALRAQINSAIKTIEDFIKGQMKTSTPEHQRLLEGLSMYITTGLDGRFRARYDTTKDELVFTEGKIKYYEAATTVDNYYIDAGEYVWVPDGRVVTDQRQVELELAGSI